MLLSWQCHFISLFLLVWDIICNFYLALCLPNPVVLNWRWLLPPSSSLWHLTISKSIFLVICVWGRRCCSMPYNVQDSPCYVSSALDEKRWSNLLSPRIMQLFLPKAANMICAAQEHHACIIFKQQSCRNWMKKILVSPQLQFKLHCSTQNP